METTAAPDWPPCRHTQSDICVSKQATITRLGPEEKVDVDGKLDEPVWRRTQPISDFVQLRPVEGVLPTERTEVSFAYDDNTLYIGARMFSHNPEQLRAMLARRDDYGDHARTIVSIDTYLELRK